MSSKRISKACQARAVVDAQGAVRELILQRFRALEAREGLRQVDLARGLGVSKAQIHEWLSDPRNITLKAAARLLSAMDARLAVSLSEAEREGAPDRADR